MKMQTRWLGTALPLALIVALALAPGASADGTAPRSHFFPLALQGRHLAGGAHVAAPTAGTVDCINRSHEQNVNMDCKTTLLPNNELNVAVDPNDPAHMVASSNDYESCCDEFYTSFDGGRTWASGDISTVGGDITGSDPVSIISKKTGTVFHASLNFANDGSFSDVVSSRSTDGGLNWDTPQVVYQTTDPTVFNDKEWITVDNYPSSPYYGRVYVTWTRFDNSGSPIWMSSSSDDGLTWSEAMDISGNNASICTFHADRTSSACDSDQFSVPTVGADGTVFVSFVNDQNQALWEPGEMFDDQILVVLSKTGGVHWTNPVMAASLEDGSRDYPINVDGRQTLTGLQLRLGQNTGGVAAGVGRMYVVWSDNRNGVHDSDNPVTNSDVFVAMTTDFGRTWSAPVQVTTSPEDQWQAWIDATPTPRTDIGIVFLDRGYGDPALYDLTLAIGQKNLKGGFALSRVSTESSDPTNSAFFRAGIPGCERCSRFNGDYNGIAFGPDGRANIVWTDMRREKAGHGHLENGFFAVGTHLR